MILEKPNYWLYKYAKGYLLFRFSDEDYEREGLVKKYWGNGDDEYDWEYPELNYEHEDICPVCLIQKLELSPKGRSTKKTCSNPICKEVYKHFDWWIQVKDFNPIPQDYIYFSWAEKSKGYRIGDGVRRQNSENERTFQWKHWKHREQITRIRSEVMATMYLNGQIELSEEAIPYLDKKYCKPIKYKSINKFNYEEHKSNSDTLRNYGWSDLLLSGITPTRSKPPKHAKHHKQS